MRRSLLTLGVIAMVVFSFGCAYTDYSGYGDHKTLGEAKFWGAEIAFSGSGDPTLDGSYSYTAKYDNRGGQGTVTITSYRNPVFSSFSRDGQIDRDGDDVQGNMGDAGGKFLTQFVSVDSTGGGLPNCEFRANVTQNKSNTPTDLIPIALCGVVEEEVDNDFDLHAAFASLDSLIGQIWSGALTGEFGMTLTEVGLNGNAVAVNFPISAYAGAMRPGRFVVDLSQPGAAGLIQAILGNTVDGAANTVSLTFDGGMSVTLPVQVSFSHAALSAML